MDHRGFIGLQFIKRSKKWVKTSKKISTSSRLLYHDVMSFVYLIQNSKTLAVKIGHSRNPDRRLKELQTGCQDKLNIIHRIGCNRVNPRGLEKRLHHWFRFQKTQKGRQGEWFQLSEEDIKFVQSYFDTM